MSEMQTRWWNTQQRQMAEVLRDGGVVVEWISGICPVEATGTLDGQPFYFRARGEYWSFHVPHDASMNIHDTTFNSELAWWAEWEVIDSFFSIEEALYAIAYGTAAYRAGDMVGTRYLPFGEPNISA